MWLVAKVNIKKMQFFKDNFTKIYGKKSMFYLPKIRYEQSTSNNKIKKIEKAILGTYIFCYSSSFTKEARQSLQNNIKGLEYFLNGFVLNQLDIQNFINYCKSFEDEKGFLQNSFFKKIILDKGKFISGPFKDMIFSLISKHQNFIKILLNNKVVTVDKNINYLYQPV